MIGRVVSIKMQHTVTVLVEGKKTHRLYDKSFVRSKKYLVDDGVGVALGDIVEIIKIKPVSKRKHWQIAKVIGKDIIALGTEELKKEAKEAIEEILPEESVEGSLEEVKVEKEEVVEEKPKTKKIKESKKIKKEGTKK